MKFVDFTMPWEQPYQFIHPSVTVEGMEDEHITFTVKCWGGAIAGYWYRVEFCFQDVLEYRWLEFWTSYADFELPKSQYSFSPGEVVNSVYVENILSKGILRAYPGDRIQGASEEDVRHFMLPFDDYGTFHIIALAYTITIGEQLSMEAPEEQFRRKT